MDIKILVATHKRYEMPKDSMYISIHVGRDGKEELGYLGDNSGDNISLKNKNYCELTGLYWAWKNLECDYIGLCHYRRYFSIKNIIEKYLNKNNKFNLILNRKEVESLLENCDIVLPKKRNYYIETVYSHYKNAHYEKDMIQIKNIITEIYPDYLDSFNRVMNGKKLYLYNMFIMKKTDFNEYNEWLFNILFELEKRIDISNYDAYQSRIYGFLSERLFNIWILHKKLKVNEIDVLSIEKIDWIKKIKEFLNRKYKI
ncbi:MAG: DUF4422 domain-containing protein [Cetobacterium sp.]